MSMTDREIVERLRNGEERKYDGGVFIYTDLEAADAIERLTKERDEAIEALRVAIDAVNGEGGVTVGQIHAAAAILSKHEVKP